MNETYRCGWRVQRPTGTEIPPFGYPGMVVVRRGDFRLTLPPGAFDAMSDNDFSHYVERAYRETAFERLQQDLDVLARQLIGELERTNGLIITDVSPDDVKAALYRWQRTDRDTKKA